VGGSSEPAAAGEHSGFDSVAEAALGGAVVAVHTIGAPEDLCSHAERQPVGGHAKHTLGGCGRATPFAGECARRAMKRVLTLAG